MTTSSLPRTYDPWLNIAEISAMTGVPAATLRWRMNLYRKDPGDPRAIAAVRDGGRWRMRRSAVEAWRAEVDAGARGLR